MRNTFAAPRRMCVIDNTKDSISKSFDFEDSFRLTLNRSVEPHQTRKGCTQKWQIAEQEDIENHHQDEG